MSQPLKIFISYARKDAAFKDELLVHLAPLIRNKDIIVWHDNDTLPGEEFDDRIKQELAAANVVIFLVSPNFMASEYIRKEIQQAIERQQRKELVIVPVWIIEIGIPDETLNRFQSLPKDRKPVDEWRTHDAAWADVVRQLDKLFKNLKERNTTDTQSPAAEAPKRKSTLDKNNIRNLIANDKIRDALQTLLDYTEHNDADNHNALTMLMARFNKLKRDEGMGILSTGDAQLERNRINAALLNILGDL